MYKFIKDFNTHDKIEGSENLPDWYKLDKKVRKEFCRYGCAFFQALGGTYVVNFR
jgi:uncharacterized protein YutD